ncbi:MAG: hypothetical protein A2408_01225 [Candidatus Yonathbacteria bacterium RIFOXYC1_FULL_52_10]|uniref:Uncharacterized protein n=1 Tax=Candidatus Yonathbacteria bacterium RIFOXYD1_FULL_52_36 TaxID=1802730 RepID=A0A1G2SKS1_9BACT|nr:MAG: hypothetical protein A2408_01225 [Candidatus Yonathbacteria bacterium RIFOXYC1_FULL_52_10]OHA85586.1 MAG: hypothetical protein A2591_00280 [Candidatus Yonathbacteria bacterium RIFOXYD1_FULL_52_36]
MKSLYTYIAGGIAVCSLLVSMVLVAVPGGVVYAQGTITPQPPAGQGTITPQAPRTTNVQPVAGSGETIRFPNPTPYNSLMELLHKVLEAIVRILMPVIAVMLIYSGFLFVTAGGDTKKLEDAKKTFFGTIIGAAIVLGAWALATAIAGTIQRI